MTNPRRLGRGLEALLGRPLPGSAEGEVSVNLSSASQRPDGPVQVHVYDIENNPFSRGATSTKRPSPNCRKACSNTA